MQQIAKAYSTDRKTGDIVATVNDHSVRAMPRRRKKESPLEALLMGPWHLSAGACIASLIAALLMMTIARGNVFLNPLATIGKPILLVLSAAFGCLAIIKFLSRRSPDNEQGLLTNRPPTSRETTVSSVLDFAPPPRIEPYIALKPTRWSLEVLQSIDWKRFEEVVAAYFREKNFRCVTQTHGPDGGIDGTLYFGDSATPVGVVQCKAWGRREVGVGPIRELLGVMTHQKVRRGYFAATGEFTDEAIRFAGENPIMLITGRDFLAAIEGMDSERQSKLLAVSTEGDYKVPTCASCGDKLHMKRFRTGSAWVCKRFPKCRTKIWTKTA